MKPLLAGAKLCCRGCEGRWEGGDRPWAFQSRTEWVGQSKREGKVWSVHSGVFVNSG
jgi:hypothetical protein